MAFGDHQVANVAAEIEARTIGAVTNAGFLAPGRHWGVEPSWGFPQVSGPPQRLGDRLLGLRYGDPAER